jgi:gluconolactonase
MATSLIARKFAEGFMFPEGPVFDKDGDLYVVNLKGGHISRVSPKGEVTKFVETGGAPNGAAIRRDNHLLVADCGLKAILDISPEGKIRIVADKYQGRNFMGPNDLAFDSNGNLYFTDPEGSSLDNPIGAVYCLTKEEKVLLVANSFAYPNGVAISSDGKTLYVAESSTGNIYQIPLKGDGTAVTKPKIWAKLGEEAEPDGMAFAANGELFVACFKKGAIAVIAPDGILIKYLPAGGAHPTNVAFGGIKNSQLYITETETNAVYVLDLDVEGQQLFG